MAEEESANDPQFLGLLHLGWDTAVFVVKPVGIFIGSIIYYVAFSVLFVLRLLWRPLQFLLLPVLYLGDFILRCILAPFRFLAKFETLYIYLGIAALLGVAGGVIISLISGGLQSLLGLDREAAAEGRTVQQWRKSRRKPHDNQDDMSTSGSAGDLPQTGHKKGNRKGRNRPGKAAGQPTTILEELDSDY